MTKQYKHKKTKIRHIKTRSRRHDKRSVQSSEKSMRRWRESREIFRFRRRMKSINAIMTQMTNKRLQIRSTISFGIATRCERVVRVRENDSKKICFVQPSTVRHEKRMRKCIKTVARRTCAPSRTSKRRKLILFIHCDGTTITHIAHPFNWLYADTAETQSNDLWLRVIIPHRSHIKRKRANVRPFDA